LIFRFGKFLFSFAEIGALYAQQLYLAVLPPQKAQKAVDRHQHRICACRFVCFRQMRFITDHRLLVHLLSLRQKGIKGLRIPQVFFNGACAALLAQQAAPKFFQCRRA